MTTDATKKESTGHVHLITVHVGFPVSKNGPYAAQVAPETTVGAVRQAAMQHFGVADDGQFAYVLTHGGQEQPNDRTVGEIAGHANDVKFQLVKKITQG